MVIERKSAHRRPSPCGSRRGQRVAERVPHRRPSRKSVSVASGPVFFCGRIPQHMERPRAADWLAGGAMLLAAASWGLVASLLAS
jgi:hypothetical protein